MVAHQEQLAGGDDPAGAVARDGRRLRRIAGRLGVEVRLVDLVPLMKTLAVADLDGVAGEADDALDERRAVGLDPVGAAA